MHRSGWVEDDAPVEDHAAVKVAAAVGPGDEFPFTFHFGDRWAHRCRVLTEKIDPRQEWDPGRCLANRSRSGAGA